jgi:hypothetical protein
MLLQLQATSIISVVAPDIWAQAQVQHIHVQNNTWNSSFTLPPFQIAAANLLSTLVDNIEVATNFERTI